MTTLIVAVLGLNLMLGVFSFVHHVRTVHKIGRYMESLRARRAIMRGYEQLNPELVDAEINALERAREWNRSVAAAAVVVIAVNVTLAVTLIARAAL